MSCRREHFFIFYLPGVKITPHCSLLLLCSDRWSRLFVQRNKRLFDHHSRRCWVTWQMEQSNRRSKECDSRCGRSSVWTEMFIFWRNTASWQVLELKPKVSHQSSVDLISVPTAHTDIKVLTGTAFDVLFIVAQHCPQVGCKNFLGAEP